MKKLLVLVTIITLLVTIASCDTRVSITTAPIKDVPSDIYVMHGFSGGADRVTLFATWASLNPSRGRYDWTRLDAYVAQHQAVSLMVTTQRSGYYGNDIYIDDTPGWVGGTRRIAVGDKMLVLPAYDSAAWQKAYRDFVAAFGAHYDDNPKIIAVTVGMGLDGETHAYKRGTYGDIVNEALPGYLPAFEKYGKECVVWYANAFPKTRLYCANNPGGQAFRKALLGVMIQYHVGIKNAGLQVDNPTGWGPNTYETPGGCYPIWGPAKDLGGTLGLWIESQSGNVNKESVHWAILYALPFKPDAIDLHKEWFDYDLAWAREYMQSPPGVWVVFRDDEYGPYFSNIAPDSKYYLSGRPGDFEFGLRNSTDAVRVWRKDLPETCHYQVESRQVRQGEFVLDADIAGRLVRVCYLDTDAPIEIRSGQESHTFGGGGSGRMLWHEHTFDAPAYAMYISESTLHMVELLAAPTPTATPSATATDTPTSTPSATATETVTPSATPTAVVSKTETTATPTISKTETVAPITATPTAKPCWARENFTWNERQNIVLQGYRELWRLEENIDPWNDPTIILGNDEKLGAPATQAYTVIGDDGCELLCRGYTDGIIVIKLKDNPKDGCRDWTVVLWDGSQR